MDGPVNPRVHAGPVQAPVTPPLPAVARIVVPEKDGISFGSGTLIDARGQFGLVVSNWHVVRDAAGQITVEFPDGFKSPAQVVKTDKDWDLAALSIYRPQATPLPISPQAPQPGEPLTIAGYGSGQWRTANGRCTQYLAPGVEFPHEMVELSAEARQGDSGGPILNERGELAGVLFGSGPGYTSGSYGGRVLQFLATVVPGGAPGSDGLATIASAAPPPAPAAPQATVLHQHEPPLPREPAVGPPSHAVLTPVAPPGIDPLLAPPPRQEVADRFGTGRFLRSSDEVDARVAVVPSRVDASPQPLASTSALMLDRPPDLPAEQLTPRHGVGVLSDDIDQSRPGKLLAAVWRQFGGETPFDQAKSVLAIIGMLAIFVVFVRFGSRKEPEHHEE